MTPQEVANDILLDKELVSKLRMYIWDGFAAHNIADLYEKKGKFPFSGDNQEWMRQWLIVRNILYPEIKKLYDQFGEFGLIP